jgi:uncharacterized membrane protein (Fun14 family)
MDISQFLGPIAPSLGFGGAAGLAVGYTAKKLTKLLALLLGCAFILVQLAAYEGFVTVNWGVVQDTAAHAWTNPEGVTLVDRLWHIVTANVPFGGGFIAGFALGLKYG